MCRHVNTGKCKRKCKRKCWKALLLLLKQVKTLRKQLETLLLGSLPTRKGTPQCASGAPPMTARQLHRALQVQARDLTCMQCLPHSVGPGTTPEEATARAAGAHICGEVGEGNPQPKQMKPKASSSRRPPVYGASELCSHGRKIGTDSMRCACHDPKASCMLWISHLGTLPSTQLQSANRPRFRLVQESAAAKQYFLR